MGKGIEIMNEVAKKVSEPKSQESSCSCDCRVCKAAHSKDEHEESESEE